MSEREDPKRKPEANAADHAEPDEKEAIGSSGAPKASEVQFRATGGREGTPPLDRIMGQRQQAGAQVMQRAAIMRKVGSASEIGSTSNSGASVPQPKIFLSRDGTPGNNQDQNRQFRDAVREIGKKIGRKLSDDEEQKLHKAISKQNMGYHEIVEEGVAMFGSKK